MQNTTSDHLDYCKKLIKVHDYGRYLQCAFLPAELGVRVIGYYALEAELKHIHHHVSEEMIGHIRYAWWREEMDKLGQPHQNHPVLQLLAAGGIDKETLIALVDAYREAYPAMPSQVPELTVENERWKRAGSIIQAHQEKSRLLLLIRLLFV